MDDRVYKKPLFDVERPGAWIDMTPERRDLILSQVQSKIEGILTELDHDIDGTLRQHGLPFHVQRTFKLVPNGE